MFHDIKIDKNNSITDIGLDYGYSSSNYSSAFRKHHNISPYEFRKTANTASKQNPFYPIKLENFETFNDYASRIKIKEIDDVLVLYERLIGNYIELKEKWFHFMDTYKDFIKDDTLMIERFYDDPSITSLSRCLCDMCLSVDETCELDNKATIKGGKFAVYRYEGEIPNIFRTLQGVFSIWLPESGYEMDERYGLNIYREIDKVSGRVVMDLCIPIR
ncbi:MAG TPA: GyrI-like domain-containing protein [Lachnospiraceae bacterium]|nr:GyrI-like domain-containing protein [Lachnospiraceae bacterium]